VETIDLAPALAKIEESMRQALRQHAAMHVVERTVLLRAVGRVRVPLQRVPLIECWYRVFEGCK